MCHLVAEFGNVHFLESVSANCWGILVIHTEGDLAKDQAFSGFFLPLPLTNDIDGVDVVDIIDIIDVVDVVDEACEII